MDPLSVVASAAGIISLGIQVTQSLVDFYSAYKSQKSDVAHTIKKLEHLLVVLETLRNQLANRKFCADEQDLRKTIESSIQDCEECIHELQSECDKFKHTAAGIGAAARTAARKLAYPFRQSTLQKLDEDVDDILSHLSLALQVLQQKDVGNVRDDIEDTKALLDLVRASQISSAIRDWLRAPDAAINYNEACKKRHSGTGLWFVKGSAFSAWLTKPNSFLWLNGFAGCGKSVLCSTAIQHAFRHRRSNPRIGIAFFFFTFNDDAKQDTSAMLRALVLQLSGQLSDNHGLLSRLHDSYRNAMPPDPALMGCLQQLAQAFDDVYIILDALDESPRDKYRGDVLQALVDMRTWSKLRLHLLVTSRDEPDIRRKICALQDETISMKNDSVDTDIAGFISNHLRLNEEFEDWEEYYDRIETELIKRANGVFRWVECQFKALKSCPQSEDLLDQLLASLPLSLDETYERMLSCIAPASVEYARRLLTLLCRAMRPLTVAELIDAVAVDLSGPPKFNPKRKLKNADAIHRVCPGLIEIDVDPRDGRTTVRIAHFSVQEYLESGRLSAPVAAFSVKSPEAHAEIACICLTYLLEPTISIPKRLIGHALAPYAAKSWHEHFRDGDKNMLHVEQQAIRLFRSPGSAFENWVQIWNVDSYDGKKPSGKTPSPLYYASLLGLDSVVAELLCEKPCGGSFISLNPSEASELVNTQGGGYGNALQAASAGGHEAIVERLLAKGADVNAQGGRYGNTLQAASAGGHEAIVERLLAKGADVNAQGGYYGNALQAASTEGHDAVVERLLAKGADVNTQGGWYGNALQAASAGGHDAIVERLLAKGADVNAQGGQYGNALQAASAGGHEAIVERLLAKGADVNTQGGWYGNALQAASAGGHEAVVERLLAKGADVNAQGGYYGNALQAASAGGHEAIVERLLAKGADASAGSYAGDRWFRDNA